MDINKITVRVESKEEDVYVRRIFSDIGFQNVGVTPIDLGCFENKGVNDVVCYHIHENELLYYLPNPKDKTIISAKEFKYWRESQILEEFTNIYPRTVGLTQEIIDNYKKTTKGSAVCEVDETKIYQLTLSTLLDKGIDAREAVEIAMLTIK